MNKEFCKKIVEKLISNQEIGEYAKFESSQYKAIKFDASNFKEIKEIDSKQNMAFIDGGNIEIAKGPSFSLQLINLYYTIYRQNKRTSARKISFLLLVKSAEKNNEICFTTETFGVTGSFEHKDLVFSSLDNSIKQGNNRINPTAIAMVYRRFSEITLAKYVTGILSKNDIIIFDGDLQAKFTYEPELLDELYSLAKEKMIKICGLSKTSELMTNTGYPLLSAINKLAGESNENAWFYSPLVVNTNKNHKADLFIIKLKPKNEHCFRFDIHNEIQFDINVILSLLKNNASDPLFLGYPYGLIEAHLFAKCSSQEKEYILTKLKFYSNKELNMFENNVNSHELLDRM